MKLLLSIICFIGLVFSAEKTSTYDVKGMMCGNGCVKTIEKELKAIEGIKEYKVSYEKGTMIITYDEALVNKNIIIEELHHNTTYSYTLKKETNSFIDFFKSFF